MVHSSTGWAGSNWKIVDGYLRQKTWIDFQFKGIFIIAKDGNFIWDHKNPEKNPIRHSKSLSMPEFPFWKYPFLLVLYTVCYDFDRDFECLPLGDSFFWILLVPYKISYLCNNENTIWLKICSWFLFEITIYNLPTWPGKPCTSKVSYIFGKNISFSEFFRQFWKA